nr:hypothetical protein [Tanacetum cinerariifolium]
LKRRVKKLEKRNRLRTHGLKRLYKGRRINAIDADEDITLVSDADNEMFDVDVLGSEEVFIAGQNKNVVEEVVDVAQPMVPGFLWERWMEGSMESWVRWWSGEKWGKWSSR